jgi:hypothetical protein
MPRKVTNALTPLSVKNAKSGRHADGGGLYLLVKATGARSWVFRFMLNGKARDVGLGAAAGPDSLSLAKARVEATKLRLKVQSGIDPIEERDREEAEKLAAAQAALIAGTTFKEVAEGHIDANEESWRNPKHRQQWRKTMADYVYPKIGDLSVADVDTPADDGAKALLQADGWQPYSIRVGDKYYSYQRMDPFSSTLGVAADMVELQEYMTDKQRDKVATLITASVMQNIANKTWLSGLSGMLEAMSDPDRKADALLKRLAGSIAVPAGVAQVARTTDPTLRQAETILDAVRNRVPGLSKKLAPRRDVWGQPITSEGGVGPDIVSPLWQSTRKNDTVNNLLLQAGAHVGRPQREVGGRKLTLPEYGRYQELAGTLGNSRIRELIAAGEWARMSRDDQQDAVSDIMRDARRGARTELFPAATGR